VALLTLVVAGGAGGAADVLAAADRAAFHRGFRLAMGVAALCAAAGGVLVGAALARTPAGEATPRA
jgi:hypothetical protein